VQARPAWFNGRFGGNEVCQEGLFSDTQASVERFEYKLGKFNNLLQDASERPTAAKAFEARNRANKFLKCFQYAKTSAMPDELKALINSDSKGSLKNTMRAVRLNLVQKLKGLGMLSNSEKCGFNPEKVNIILASAGENPDMLLSKQLFGETCEAVSGVAYRAGRTEMERKLIDAESMFLTAELNLKLGRLSVGEVEHVSKQLEHSSDAMFKYFDTTSASLVELGSEAWGTLEVVLALIIIAISLIFVIEDEWNSYAATSTTPIGVAR
jgi:hypothetical protein